MSAPENVLVQSNFKTPLGGLHNAYGHDEQSFDLALAILEDRVARLTALEQQLHGAGNVAQGIGLAAPSRQPAPAAPAAAPTPPPVAPGWETPAPAPSFQQATVPQCAHGPRTARSGSGAKGPWAAWFCPQPKGTAQCDAIWVKRGTPEWDSFPG
jgi:hypothetical protein